MPRRAPSYDVSDCSEGAMKKLLKLVIVGAIVAAILKAMNIETTVDRD